MWFAVVVAGAVLGGAELVGVPIGVRLTLFLCFVGPFVLCLLVALWKFEAEFA
jgi:hypothetical protein